MAAVRGAPLRSLAAPAVTTVLVLAVACGSPTPDTSSQHTGGSLDPNNPTTVTVADVAGIPSAFLMYGKQEGMFAEHGIELQVNTGAGGAAIIPGVVSGSYDMGGSNVMSVLVGASKGVPITMVTSGTFAGAKPESAFGAILAAPDSGIQKPADLAGKKLAVNTLEGIADLTTRIALENHGVDPSSVELVEIGFPDMLPALEQGRVDAAWEIEPFVTMARNAGNEPVLYPYLETKPGMQVGSYVTSDRYMRENPDVVAAFQAAARETATAISEDPAAFREALPELTELSPEAAERMNLPQWKGTVDRSSLRLVNEASVEYGFIENSAEVAGVLAPGATG